jgi:hypothetical protein
MAEVDISSYPKPGLPVSPLDVAGKVGGLIQQKINIDQSKLNLMNNQFEIMNKELSTMIDDPTITKDQAAQRLDRISKTLNLPPIAVDHMKQELAAAPDVKSFSENALRRGMDVNQRINQQYGTTETQTDQSRTFQGVRAPAAKGGGFTPATELPTQLPPGTQYYDKNNQQKLLPPAGPSGIVPSRGSLNPGVPAATTVSPTYVRPVPPGAAPPIVPKRMPVERISGPTGPTTQTGYDFAQRFAGDGGQALNAGASPLFEEGKKAYSVSQLNASSRAQSIKPAIQALKLMPGLSTGPGTAQFNDLVAAAKAWGVVNTKAENDPTVLRQELEKKLAQYVGSSPLGQRSDAQQALAEAGSPNPKKQILPALQNLTRDAIALDRVQILKPNAFKGTDYQNYIKHEGTFPQSVNEKALTLDLLDKPERDKIITQMTNKYKNNPNDKEAVKFLNTLKLAKEHGLYDAGD